MVGERREIVLLQSIKRIYSVLEIICVIMDLDVQVLNLRVLHLYLIASHLFSKVRLILTRTKLITWRYLLEISEEIRVEHVLSHFLHQLSILLHELILIFDFELFHLVLTIELNISLAFFLLNLGGGLVLTLSGQCAMQASDRPLVVLPRLSMQRAWVM